LKPIGVEAAWVRGPLSVQGEFVRLNMTRHAPAPDLGFDGGYVYVAYSLTGEQRPFDSGHGAFASIRPRGKTAVELLARVSWLDLDDKSIRGGKEVNYTAGLNWYLNPHARTMFNVIAVDSKRQGRERNPVIAQARLQLDW
jgi:phosphate-selective porin OprO/OprP